jgi:hypothetical protein
MSQPDVWTATFVRRDIAEERARFEGSFDDPDPDVAMEVMAW